MQVTIPDEVLPAKIIVNPESRMDDEEYWALCMANPDVRIERTAEGEIVIVPPAGGESDYQSQDAARQLGNWAKQDGRGKAFGSSAAFILPTKAAYSPDAAWVSNGRLAGLSKEQRRKYLRVTPEFVVEVMSLSDRLSAAEKKMEEWLRGGTELAWLIHGDRRTVYVYRRGQAVPEAPTGISEIAGEGPVVGFNLELTDIWAGL
jgi:Uma2 family endonuclease